MRAYSERDYSVLWHTEVKELYAAMRTCRGFCYRRKGEGLPVCIFVALTLEVPLFSALPVPDLFNTRSRHGELEPRVETTCGMPSIRIEEKCVGEVSHYGTVRLAQGQRSRPSRLLFIRTQYGVPATNPITKGQYS
jgi:hypothetical protein